jgi:hypothetical protein
MSEILSIRKLNYQLSIINCQLFYVHYQTDPIRSRHRAIASLYLQRYIVAYVKCLQMRIHSGICYLQPPEKNKEEHGIIYILANGIAERPYSFRLKTYAVVRFGNENVIGSIEICGQQVRPLGILILIEVTEK